MTTENNLDDLKRAEIEARHAHFDALLNWRDRPDLYGGPTGALKEITERLSAYRVSIENRVRAEYAPLIDAAAAISTLVAPGHAHWGWAGKGDCRWCAVRGALAVVHQQQEG